MKSIRLSLGLVMVCLGAASLWGAVPDTLSLEDLQGHPERWPRTLVLTQDVKLEKGMKLAKGKEVLFVELLGDKMALEADREIRVHVPVAGSNLLAEANKLWAALTPAQRAVDTTALAADASLWPDRVKAMEELHVTNEWEQVQPGQECFVLSCEPDGVQLGRANKPQQPIIVDARQTDIIERARERAVLPVAQRSSRLAAALAGNLVDAQGQAVTPAHLAETQLFAFYFGAGWCAPCKQFSPHLVKALGAVAAQNPRLTVIYLSNDKTTAGMRAYMQGVQMPWAGVELAQWRAVPALTILSRGTVPQLVVIDRHGRVLADSFQGDRYVGPQGALQELLRRLDSGVAR